MMATIVGTLAGLRRYPVKSMLGEQPNEAEITERGLFGDRGYALIETATNKVVSAKSVKLYPDLLACSAAYVEPPRVGAALPPVRITLGSGAAVTSDSADVDATLSAFFRREVVLARTAPEDFTIDEYRIGDDGEGIVSSAKLGAALFAQLGLGSPVPAGSFLDAFPVSVLTTSTIDHLNALRPASRFDERRFRMNVLVHTDAAGFVENAWVRRRLQFGAGVRLRVALADPRCVMTTLAQTDLPNDVEVLRTLTRHNSLLVGSTTSPCAGVYAVVEAAGTLRVGDQITLV